MPQTEHDPTYDPDAELVSFVEAVVETNDVELFAAEFRCLQCGMPYHPDCSTCTFGGGV